MKKLISLLLALILLVSAVPSLAASLTPETVIGTWEEYRLLFDYSDSEDVDIPVNEASGLDVRYQFHADGTGLLTVKYTGVMSSYDLKWTVKGSKVEVLEKLDTNCYSLNYMKLKGSSLVISSKSDDGNCTTTAFYKKTSESSGKNVKKAILSTGTYKLNNGKKTAVFLDPASKNVTSLKIPDTIRINGKNYKVTEIGDNACLNLKKLSSVTIGKNVKTIGYAAFADCKALKKITFKGTSLGKVKANAFAGIKNKATVTCPKAKLTKYTKLLQKAGLPKTAKIKAK